MSRVQRRARAPSPVEDRPRPWRGIRPLSSRAFRARLARARRAEKQAWETADGFAQALLFRYYRALERGARIPRRQRGRRPRAARQRLSLRHGHAGGRVAGSRSVDFGRRAVGHSRRACAGVAWRGRRQDAGVRPTRSELTLLGERAAANGGGEKCRNKWRGRRVPSARATAETWSISTAGSTAS